jgi:hypothetical protein
MTQRIKASDDVQIMQVYFTELRSNMKHSSACFENIRHR